MTYLLPVFTSAPAINAVHNVDALTLLRAMPDNSVNTIITSPPYFGLRSYLPNGDYNKVREIGLEPTPQAYVAALTELFREARRVLRANGTLWLNLGDSYGSSGGDTYSGFNERYSGTGLDGGKQSRTSETFPITGKQTGLPSKSLLGIPWRVAFALQDDGWILRSDIIWAKSNPMPESVTDRPTKSHEYVFLFAKSPRYYYDAAAIAEPAQDWGTRDRTNGKYHNEGSGLSPHHGLTGGNFSKRYADAQPDHGGDSVRKPYLTRNKRDVWTVNSKPFHGSHFATFPPDLIEPMILAGCPSQICSVCGAPWVRKVEAVGGTIGKGWHDHKNDLEEGMSQVKHGGGVGNARDENGQHYQRIDKGFYPTCTCNAPTHTGLVLDPFMGAGTTAVVAQSLGRNYIGSELNPAYCEMARRRIQQQTLPLPLFDTVVSQEAL